MNNEFSALKQSHLTVIWILKISKFHFCIFDGDIPNTVAELNYFVQEPQILQNYQI